MAEARSDDHANARIRPFPVPEPVQVGGWWRCEWRFTLPGEADLSAFEVPPPPADFAGPAVLVHLARTAPDMTLRTFDRRGPGIAADLITYMSLIALRLKEVFGDEVAFEGMRDHPLFKVSRRPG